jgi:hypothetical protein
VTPPEAESDAAVIMPVNCSALPVTALAETDAAVSAPDALSEPGNSALLTVTVVAVMLPAVTVPDTVKPPATVTGPPALIDAAVRKDAATSDDAVALPAESEALVSAPLRLTDPAAMWLVTLSVAAVTAVATLMLAAVIRPEALTDCAETAPLAVRDAAVIAPDA